MTGFMNSSVEDRRAKKIKKEEDEIEQMILEATGEPEDQPEEVSQKDSQEEATEEKDQSEDKSETLSKDEEIWKKRYSDLRRSSSKTKSELEAKVKDLESSTPKEMVLPASDEEIEVWQEKFPDIARIVETLATKKAAEKFGEAEEEIRNLKAENTTSTIERMETKIRTEVPDYDDLKESEVFLDWLDQQPTSVQNSLYENNSNADDAIWVFKLYKERVKSKAQKKESTKDAATLVDTKNSPTVDVESSKDTVLESWVDGLSMLEFEKEEPKILAAMRDGNFVYDLSGGAR